MNYYTLRQDQRIPGQPSVMSCPEKLDPVELIDGKLLPDPGPLQLALSPRSGDIRGCIIEGLVTLFHEDFRDLLTRLGVDNIQYFPVELKAPDGMIERAYSLVNVLGLLEAVDVSQSVIRPRAGGVRGQLYSFKIDPAKALGQRFFRIVEAPTLIVIDQTLRDALEASHDIPGIVMLPTERYNGW